MGDVVVKTIKQQFALVTRMYVREGKGSGSERGKRGQRRWSGVATI